MSQGLLNTAANESTSNGDPLINLRRFGQGMAVIRVFFGLIIFMNGLAKIDDRFVAINLGPYHTVLINRSQAHSILNFEVNQRQIRKNGALGSQVPGVKWFVNHAVLKHWNVFQWVTTIIELGAGVLLILGLASRFGALVDLGQQIFLALVYASSARWMFEQPHEYVPLIVLAVLPAGRIWGLDGVLVHLQPRLRRWPF